MTHTDSQTDPSAPPPIPLRTRSAPPSSAPPAPQRNPVLHFWIDLGIAIVSLIGLSVAGAVGLAVFQAARGGAAAALAPPGALAQILIAVFATGGTAAVLYLLRARATATERTASMQSARRPSTLGIAVLTGLGIFVGSTVLTLGAAQLGVQPKPTNMPLMQDAMQRFPVFLAVFAVLLAPLYEEVLFRRALFGRLWRGGRPVLGMLLSGAAFALVHEIPGTSDNGPLQILLLWTIYGGMGIAFAWIYRRTGTLLAPIIAHAINNGIAVIALFMGFGV